MKKKLVVLSGLIIGLTLLTSCSRTKQEIKEQRRFWGSKEQCVSFLQSNKAVADRWVLEALGE